MATPQKQAAIAELTGKFRDSGAAVLTEYRGLTVSQLKELRNSLRANGTYSVVKNTLTDIAAKEAGVTAFEGQLTGPSAIAFITGDPVEAAKSLRDFAKAHPLLVIKSGYFEGKPLSAEEITKLADLESREVLLAKLAGAMKASLSNAVYLFAAPLSQFAATVDALRAKVEEQGGAAAEAPAAEAPAAEAPAAEAPAAEAPAAESADSTDSAASTEAPAAEAEATADVAEGGDAS